MQTAIEKPRFRTDLVAQPIEEEGIRYVDVSDPTSGSTFRFYDVEYLIASAMDGARDLAGIAEWTRTELGIETSADELLGVVNTLAELGYLEANHAAAAETPEAVDAETALEVGKAYDQAMELGPPGRSSMTPERTTPRAPETYELGPPGGAAATGPGLDTPTLDLASSVGEVPDLSSVPELDEPDMEVADDTMTVDRSAASTVTESKAPLTEEETSFAGLMDDDSPKKQAAALAPPMPSPPPVREIHRGHGAHAKDEEDTNLPHPAVEEDEEELQMEAGEPEPPAAPKMERVTAQLAAVEPLPADLEGLTGDDAEEVEEDRRPTPMPLPPPTPPAARSPIPLPAESRPRPIGVGAVDLPPSPPPRREPPRMRAAPPASSNTVWYLVFLLVVAGGAAVYFYRDTIFGASSYSSKPTAEGGDKNNKNPPAAKVDAGGTVAMAAADAGGQVVESTGADAGAAIVETTPPDAGAAIVETTPPDAGAAIVESTPPDAGTEVVEATPDAGSEVVSAPPPTATLVEEGSEVEAVAAQAGQVAWVVADGSDVNAGDVVAKLTGFQKSQQEIDNVNQRLEHYTHELEKAQAKGNAAAIKAAEAKVKEKQDLITKAQESLEAYLIKAPVSGPVTIVVGKGKKVDANGAVAKVGGKGLYATFDTSTAYEVGSRCVVADAAVQDKQHSCVVDKVEGSSVKVRIVPGANAAAGDTVALLPPK